MKKKFAFVILNYMTAKETEECINSIYDKCKKTELKIYIVDNCSPDKSGELLKKKYKKDSRIEVILNDDNIGFARGNNVGFIKAKNEYKADYIILANSDTVLLTDDFCNKIDNKHKEYDFAVLGPKEILPDGSNFPLVSKYPTIEATKINIRVIKSRYKANNSKIYSLYYKTKGFVKRVKRGLKRRIKKLLGIKSKVVTKEKLDPNIEYKDLMLHGFFLIFSKTYIDKFDGLDDRTYFYGEEDILMIRLKRAGMHSLYDPSLEVFHNKGVSTNKKDKDLKAKNNFIYSSKLKSLYILLEELEKDK